MDANAVEPSTDQPQPDDETKEFLRELVSRQNELADRLDDMEGRIDGIEADVQENSGLLHALRSQISTIRAILTPGGEITEAEKQHRSLWRQVETVRNDVTQLTKEVETLEGFGGAGVSDGEAWQSVVDSARNLKTDANHGLPDNRVQLFKEEIVQATGWGKRHAQNKIEDWGEEKTGVDWRPYEPPSAKNNNEPKKKRLVVDLDVWGGGG